MFKTSPLLRVKSSEEIFPEGFSLHYAQISSVRCSAMKSIQAVSSLNPHVWTRPHTGNGENFRLHFFLHKIKHLTLKGSISVTIIQNRSLGACWALTSGPLDPPDSKHTESKDLTKLTKSFFKTFPPLPSRRTSSFPTDITLVLGFKFIIFIL